jgi:S1-C subfamily serine protease
MDRSGSSFPYEEPSEDPDEYGGEQVPGPGNDVFGAVPESGIPDITDSTLGISDSLLSENLFADLDASFDDFEDTEELETVDDGAPRGWIPPDDRLWLHPSEIGRQARVQALEEVRRGGRRPDRRGLFAAGVVGTAALTAAIAAVALAATSANPVAMTAVTNRLTSHITNVKTPESPTVKPKAQVCSTWMSASICHKVTRVQPSIIQLVVSHGAKDVTGTAVIMPIAAETIAVTAASFVGSSQTVEAFNPSGRKQTLQVIGVDSASGIAALRVPWSAPAAPIVSNIETVSPGTELVFACRSSNGLEPAMGQVDSDDTSTPLMDTIDVDISSDATPGGVLLDSSGNVLGVLGATEDPSSDLTGEFVPSWLAEGVAEQLVDAHKVTHGWLDVMGYTGALGGAYVQSVTAKGPAAVAGIQKGDTIIGVSTAKGLEKVPSMADLRGLLYLEPPGTRIEIELLSSTGHESMVAPVLAAVSRSS